MGGGLRRHTPPKFLLISLYLFCSHLDIENVPCILVLQNTDNNVLVNFGRGGGAAIENDPQISNNAKIETK